MPRGDDGQYRAAKNRPVAEKEASEVMAVVNRLVKVPSNLDYEKAVQGLDEFLQASHAFATRWFAPIMERNIREKVQAMESETEKATGKRELLHGQRSEMSRWVNEELRERGLAIAFDGQACRLSAAPYFNRPEIGLFLLAAIGQGHQVSKKKNIEDFFPLELTASPRRVEGIANWAERETARKRNQTKENKK